MQEASQVEQAPVPTNLFYKLQKAIVAVQEEKNGSQVKKAFEENETAKKMK